MNILASSCATRRVPRVFPKGALYSHRSTVLHSMMCCAPRTVFRSVRKGAAFLVVPMFHVYPGGAICRRHGGAKLFCRGPAWTAPSLFELIVTEGVTHGARRAHGVDDAAATCRSGRSDRATDSAWTAGHRWRGGTASHVECFEQQFGARVMHAWGMTEMSPLGTVCLRCLNMSAATRNNAGSAGQQGRRALRCP